LLQAQKQWQVKGAVQEVADKAETVVMTVTISHSSECGCWHMNGQLGGGNRLARARGN
jgi:hypothetical protein